MAQKIQVLPDEVVNHIAAGEVVERPASVVKELVENAIDAGSTEISILVENGGLQEVRVVDNGTGMVRNDALTAFQRHATSKIRVSDDLGAIETLGFRGEALPSIASVSRVRMVTKEEETLSGIEISLEAGQINEIRETGCARGTDVTVRDLFFNTPARRKFQRSVATEFSHITDTVVRIALARWGIHFRLFHNEKSVLDIPPAKDHLVRIGSLLGKEVYRALHRVDAKMDSFEIEGYLSDPAFTRPNPKGIYIYVNGRSIRDRIIHRAIMEGYRSLIPKDRYPLVVLFLRIPPWGVDANVHPTKTEVRFSSSDLIYRGVIGLSHGLMRGQAVHGGERPTREGGRPVSPSAIRESTAPYGFPPSTAHPKGRDDRRASRGELFGGLPTSLRVLGQIARTYLACESSGGLILIDQHAAHERIVFERLKRALEHGRPEVQGLLFPETVELSPVEWETMQRYRDELERLGFDLEVFSRNTVVIKSVPSILSLENCSQIVSDLIRDLVAEEARGGIDKALERVLKVTACHGAIRSGQTLSRDEMTTLLQEMEEEGFFQTCPHGRPACVEIGFAQMEKMFMRSS